MTIDCEGRNWTNMPSNRICTLLCYLLLHHSHPQTREHLADLFWTEQSLDKSRKYLRKSLWQLRKTLKYRLGNATNQLIITRPGWLQINPDADIWIDITEFENRYRAVLDVCGWEMNEAQYLSTNTAVELYRGDLLDGWFDDWILLQREKYRDMYIEMLEKLMEYCEMKEQFNSAISFGEKILEQDPIQEQVHLRLIKVKWLLGDRVSAMRQYCKCRDALWDELAVHPGSELQEIYKQIKMSEEVISAFPIQPVSQRKSLDSAGIRISLQKVIRMVSDQERLRLQIMREIQSIEAALEKH